MYQAIFLDFDGVVRHWNNQRLNQLEQSFGVKPGLVFEVAFDKALLESATTGRLSHDFWLAKVEAKLREHTSAEAAYQLVRAWSKAEFEIDTFLLAAIERLLPDAKRVLVTNATDRLEADLERAGVRHWFDVVVNSANIRCAKPEPTFYSLACQLSGLSSQQVLYIDDTLSNVQTAQAQGIDSLHFVDREQILSALEKRIGHTQQVA